VNLPDYAISTEPTGRYFLPIEDVRPSNEVPDFLEARPSPTINVADVFRHLASEWKHDTAHLSVLSQRTTHPAYRSIVDMGRTAIPYILADLHRDPDHWFQALVFLTGANPVPYGFNGTVTDAVQLWIDWGHRHHMFPDANPRFVRNIP